MENKTKQTNFTQLNSLIRTRLNLRKEGKLNFKEGDNLFKKIQKLTLFIYNNAETITEKEMSEALDLVYPDTKGYTKTTFNQRKTSFDYYQSTLSNFTKSFPTTTIKVLSAISQNHFQRKRIVSSILAKFKIKRSSVS